MFYLSKCLERNREDYSTRLRLISEKSDCNGWIAFFLEAILSQSQSDIQTIRAIIALHEKMKSQVHLVTGSKYAIFLVDAIFTKPFSKLVSFPNSLWCS